jgi:hypothetical protein
MRLMNLNLTHNLLLPVVSASSAFVSAFSLLLVIHLGPQNLAWTLLLLQGPHRVANHG